MKKILMLTIFLILLASFAISQGNYNKAGMDYTDTLVKNKSASALVTGFKKYIKKYTDTSNQFVVLAYYQLSMNLFKTHNYPATVSYGNKLLKMAGLGDVEKAHLLLAMANAYAVKSASIFSIEKSKSFCFQTKKLAQKIGSKIIAANADAILRQLAFTPLSNASPAQKIKYHYTNVQYNKVISLYNALSVRDKNKPVIHKYYALSLLKAEQFERAVKELKMVFSRETTPILSYRIGEAYTGGKRRGTKDLQEGIEYFLQAGWLYSRAKQARQSSNAFKQARYWLFEKHGLNKEMERIKKSGKSNQSELATLKKKEGKILKEFATLKKRFKTEIKL